MQFDHCYEYDNTFSKALLAFCMLVTFSGENGIDKMATGSTHDDKLTGAKC